MTDENKPKQPPAPLSEEEREAKRKRAAELRAAREQAKAAEAGAAGGGADAGTAANAAADADKAAPQPTADENKPKQPPAPLSDEEREAKRKRAAELRAAREQAKAGAGAGAAAAGAAAGAKAAAAKAAKEEAPKPPSPKQPLLDRLVELIKKNVGEDAVEDAYINERDGHVPYVTIKNERWFEVASFLKSNEELNLHYLRNLTGTDHEKFLEATYHLINFEKRQNYCFKVKADRDNPEIASVQPIWETANWLEREVYDLLGIRFPGHPDLRRILLPDDWVGHPLRKDYEPLDPEV